jgi:hypothetical protein
MMIIRAIILSLGLAIGITSIGPLAQGLVYSVPGSFGAQIAIYGAVGMMVVSAVLLITYLFLDSRRPIAAFRR